MTFTFNPPFFEATIMRESLVANDLLLSIPYSISNYLTSKSVRCIWLIYHLTKLNEFSTKHVTNHFFPGMGLSVARMNTLGTSSVLTHTNLCPLPLTRGGNWFSSYFRRPNMLLVPATENPRNYVMLHLKRRGNMPVVLYLLIFFFFFLIFNIRY